MGCRAGRGQTAGRTPTILLDKRAGTIVIERGRSVDCSNINNRCLLYYLHVCQRACCSDIGCDLLACDPLGPGHHTDG